PALRRRYRYPAPRRHHRHRAVPRHRHHPPGRQLGSSPLGNAAFRQATQRTRPTDRPRKFGVS
ncbi:MAG: hypothetical protein M3Z25_13455, partial [Actinomycetota bacterium]|nr:hypothetical protein [Actinomycetota bacterium]